MALNVTSMAYHPYVKFFVTYGDTEIKQK